MKTGFPAARAELKLVHLSDSTPYKQRPSEQFLQPILQRSHRIINNSVGCDTYVYFDVGVLVFDSQGCSCDHTPTPYRDYHSIKVWYLLTHLQPHCALTSDNVGVVIATVTQYSKYYIMITLNKLKLGHSLYQFWLSFVTTDSSQIVTVLN